jgi:hypothetical protein
VPLRDPDAADPLELRGVAVPAGGEAHEEMVRAFALEYRRLGWGRDRILATCRSPFYASVHGAWRLLGEGRVRVLVDEALAPFAPGPDEAEGR